jgi:hypothetical protein
MIHPLERTLPRAKIKRVRGVKIKNLKDERKNFI